MFVSRSSTGKSGNPCDKFIALCSAATFDITKNACVDIWEF
jgi:hypothetical protein